MCTEMNLRVAMLSQVSRLSLFPLHERVRHEHLAAGAAFYARRRSTAAGSALFVSALSAASLPQSKITAMLQRKTVYIFTRRHIQDRDVS